MNEENPKSDVAAKHAFVVELQRRGYEARVTASPADVTATMADRDYFFEIKYTRQGTNYFGAATLTEWQAALDNEDSFMFVVALERDGRWVFHEYSPSEFMRFSYIPPFKVFFQVRVEGDKVIALDKGTRSVRLTTQRLREMAALFASWRQTP